MVHEITATGCNGGLAEEDEVENIEEDERQDDDIFTFLLNKGMFYIG